jgi:hypothetical protein
VTGHWLAGTVLILTANAASAALAVQEVRATYGPLGPERKALDYGARDEVCFRFCVTGFQAGRKGVFRLSVAVELRDSRGNLAAHDEAPLDGSLPFGGDSIPHVVSLRVPGEYAPGEHTVTVMVRDLQGGEASFRRKVILRTPGLAIVPPQFFYDSHRTAPAPYGGLRGQWLYFRAEAVGFDKSGDRLEAEWTAQLLDARDGGPLSEPMTRTSCLDDPERVHGVVSLTYSGRLVLHRAGDFVFRFSVKDCTSGKTAVFDAPLHVAAP